MNEYITDSIFFKKKNKDFLFYANNIFKWRVKESNNQFYFDKEVIKGNIYMDNLSGIVSPSNYRLIKDILEIDKDAVFYYPEKVINGFNNNAKYKVNKIDIDIEFEKYMKRGYLSYLSYNSLKNVGLKRIEQFLVLLTGSLFEKGFIYNNIKIIDDAKIINIIKDNKISVKKDVYLDINRFIYVVHNELNYEFIDIFSHILKLYSELKCSDPFDKKGIIFFEDDNELYHIFKAISGKEVRYIKEIIEVEYLTSKSIAKIKTNKVIKEYSVFLTNYYLFQTENNFQGKQLSSIVDYPSIIDVVLYLENIFPLKDILLTIQLLDKLKKITINNMKIKVNNSYKKRLNISDNKSWISLKTWERIYSNVDYIYNEIVEPIHTDKIFFKCPICENEVYSITPNQLFCSKLNCNFALYRTNLKKFGVDKISLENLIDGLSNENILLEKDKGGQLPVFLKKDKEFYSFWINED